MSECFGVTVSESVSLRVSVGFAYLAPREPKAFPGAEAQRVGGEVRNGWNLQGRGNWTLAFSCIPQPGASLNPRNRQLGPKATFAGELKKKVGAQVCICFSV